jgi:hypothetical protein
MVAGSVRGLIVWVSIPGSVFIPVFFWRHFLGCLVPKPLFYGGWQCDGNFF